MDQVPNQNPNNANYIMANSSISKKTPFKLGILIACNFILLLLNLLLILAPLAQAFTYRNDIYIPAQAATPWEIFLKIYYIRFVVALVFMIVSLTVRTRISHQSEYLSVDDKETVKVSKSNVAVCSMIMLEGVLLFGFVLLLLWAAFKLSGIYELVPIIPAGALVVGLMLWEYVKLIKIGFWFLKR